MMHPTALPSPATSGTTADLCYEPIEPATALKTCPTFRIPTGEEIHMRTEAAKNDGSDHSVPSLVQGFLARNTERPLLGPPEGPIHSHALESHWGAVSYE